MDDLDLEIENPPRIVPYGSKSHPMYKQWAKMLDSCTDPKHSLYEQVGAKGVTVMWRWFDFTKFVEDNEHLFEDEPSKPANLRRNFIRRKNPKAGFNPSNIEWVPKKEALEIMPNTLCVDTYLGKNMPIKVLARILEQRAGEDLPPDAPTWTQWQRVYNDRTDKIERKLVPVKTLQPLKLYVLRKRAREGLTGWDLLEPVREYGTDRLDEERETALCAELDRNRYIPSEDDPYYVRNRGFR